MQGLSVSRVVDVQVNFAPQAAPLTRFDTLLVMGDSGVIDTSEAIREYNSMQDVAEDFGTTSPEYQAAVLFFAQIPKPSTMYIGTWARIDGKARLTGGPLTTYEQLLSNWTGITTGAFAVSMDGAPATQVTGIDLSTVTNMNGVASRIQAAMRAVGTPAFT